MSIGKGKVGAAGQLNEQKALHARRWAFSRRTPTFFNWFESPSIFKRIGPYIKKGLVIADIGSGWGYYTFALADQVGPKGKVYSVDLSEKCITSIQRKADKRDCHNIEAHPSTATDLRFIKNRSVDLVFANGLLCSMENDRESAVKEMKRILKPQGLAYISLGAQPPWGLVDEAEWNKILKEFKVKKGGIYKELWVLVALK
ncbi:MAG: class I SAM-dependent methyltransferase [Anaerolineaceae bacterium]